MAMLEHELSALATTTVPGLLVRGASPVRPPFGRASDESFDRAIIQAAIDVGNGPGKTAFLEVRRARSKDAQRELAAEVRAIRALTQGVRSRLPFKVPQLVGASQDVAVLEFVGGEPVSQAELAPGSQLLTEFAEAIAAIHALPREFAVAASLPERSPAQARESADELIERAKGTGRLPVVLERRWSAAIEDAKLWQFQSSVTHGGVDLDSFQCFEGRLLAMLDWSDLRIGDPARDLRWVSTLPEPSHQAFLDAYVAERGASVDRQIGQRANLYYELELARYLTHAVESDDAAAIADAEQLLDEHVRSVHRTESRPVVHETLPVYDIQEVRDLLRDAKDVREQSGSRPAGHTDQVRTGLDHASNEEHPDDAIDDLDHADPDELDDDTPPPSFLRED